MKKVKLLILTILIYMSFGIVNILADTPAEARNAYARFLENKDIFISFALDDLNNDGIPEMKLSNTYAVYTYYKGEMTELESYKAVIEAYPEEGIIKISRGHKNGDYWEEYSCLAGGALSTLFSYSNTSGYADNWGNSISEEQYRYLIDMYTGQSAPITPFQEAHENTAENRALYLEAEVDESNSGIVYSPLEGVWSSLIDDFCTLSFSNGKLLTAYEDNNGKNCLVKSSVQLSEDGGSFYAIPEGTNEIYYFYYEEYYENNNEHVRIWADQSHNGNVAGIIGSTDEQTLQRIGSAEDAKEWVVFPYFFLEDYDTVSGDSDNDGTSWNNEAAGSGEVPETADNTDNWEYIIPYSNTRELTNADIADLTLQELCYARNEIFARYGRRFKSSELTEYFNTKSWYNGTEDPDIFDENSKEILSEIERKNVQFLLNAEKSDNHSDGYVVDQPGYDIYNVRSYAERNPESTQSNSSTENDETGTETDFSGGTFPVQTAEITMYGLYTKNQGVMPTEYDKYAKVLQSDYVDLTHYGEFTFSHEYVNQEWGTWLFDFDQDGEIEMLVWDIDDIYLYHWKLFDKRDGIVYQISEDCGIQPGNAGHGLEILRDGTIHASSYKGMASYNAEWDSYIFYQDGDVHYLYGYKNHSFVEEGYEGEPVLTETAYALDGERIDEELFDVMKTSLETRDVPYPITEPPHTYDHKDYFTRIEIADTEGWDWSVDGTLDGQ